MQTAEKDDIVIVAAKRTAIGNFGGGLATLQGHELGAAVLKSVIDETKIDASAVSEVILGQVLQGGVGQNGARQAVIHAGFPVGVPAMTINQVCGSGLRAVALAAQAVAAGDSACVIAGGQESMSQSMHATFMREPTKMGDAKLIDMMMKDGLSDAFKGYAMGVTAENIAKKWKFTRDMQDEFACASQNKAEAAQKAGKFKDEIVPVTVKLRKEEKVVDVDEFPRHGTTMESLAKLRPAFDKEGTVTAGNASGINDGAAAVMVTSATFAKEHNLPVLGRIASWAHAGVEPEIMGTGPIEAVRKAVGKAGWSLDDLDLIEANEAFAAQAMSVNHELGWDTSKVNVNGGAIALGHPIGASGARVFVTLLHEMGRRDAKKGVATLCIGGGMGVAVCVER